MTDNRAQTRAAVASIVAALVLVALKLGTGVATGSLALISAGIESSGDVIAAALTLFAVRHGRRPADAEHPYGHRRSENLAALGEAVLVFGAGMVIAYEAIRQLVSGEGAGFEAHWYIFAVVFIAIIIDTTRIVASLRAARRFGSAAFRSNAFNFAGDLAGSISVLVGLALVAMGIEQGDALAALAVSAFIFYGVTRLMRQNIDVLMDRSPDAARESAQQALDELGDEVELRRLRVRESGGQHFIDVTVAVPPASAVVEAHEQADRVEGALVKALPDSDVVVHVEPRDDVDLRQRVLACAVAEPLVEEAHDVNLFSGHGSVTVSLHLKFRPSVSLADAHRAADRVERQIEALPEVTAVQTHLEPLEEPLLLGRVRDVGDDDDRRRQIEVLVREHVGEQAVSVRLLNTEPGPALFLTVCLPPEYTLPAAHELAGRLERRLRAAQPDLVDVVVHTEPLRAVAQGG